MAPVLDFVAAAAATEVVEVGALEVVGLPFLLPPEVLGGVDAAVEVAVGEPLVDEGEFPLIHD
jgi:hypothetical protein